MTTAMPKPWWAPTEVFGPWFDIDDDKVRLLRDGAEAFPAMLEAIARAEREILLEMYWVGDDEVGAKFREALAEKARAGVTVRVIYDAIGSLAITDGFWYPVAAAGGEVRDYHPVSPFRPSFELAHVERRDHRKILVVDGENGFTGGINLARPWLPSEVGGEGWRDDMIEVRGRVAKELRTLFYKTWRRVWLRSLAQAPGGPNLPHDLVPLSKKPKGRVYVLSSLRRSRRNVRKEYLTRINRAVKSIDIANSYFIPDRSVRGALFRAVARGVRVRVLVPHKSDVAVVQFALEAMYEALLRNGVEVYCHAGPMMHAKTAIIDDTFVTIGSYNLDERSRTKNLEVNVAIVDAPFASYVRRWFDRDVAAAMRIDLFEWRARPLLRRGVEYMAYALRKLW
ncbi:Cardiolipin synthetase [Labilithrix luteola]|uniref:Cardiolipin synthetase n=1 Tax=Labilithrix luteola TaxID=1391654 RepID=A0A0K1QB02_9BACT|nr:phospholipase D-like domain-containing protein [Labilithrix luteola]AKV02913.1 Cardiolipin synthetase [Labilithrix luteola]